MWQVCRLDKKAHPKEEKLKNAIRRKRVMHHIAKCLTN